MHGPVLRKIRIRGWLLLFVLYMAVSSSVLVLSLVSVMLGQNVSWVFAILNCVVGIYGLYCVVLLVNRIPSAPRHAHQSLISGLINRIVRYVAIPRGLSGSLVAILCSLLWLIYLSKSARVAATYAPTLRDNDERTVSPASESLPKPGISDPDRLGVAPTARHQPLSGIRGWLLVLVLLLATGSLLFIYVSDMSLLFRVASLTVLELTSLDVEVQPVLSSVIYGALGIYGLSRVYLLLSKHKHAPEQVGRCLTLVAAASTGMGIVDLVAVGTVNLSSFMFWIVAALLGIVYLHRSRRIDHVYRFGQDRLIRDRELGASIQATSDVSEPPWAGTNFTETREIIPPHADEDLTLPAFRDSQV